MLRNGRAARTAKEARKQAKMSQEKFSMETHQSREAVSKQETGGYRVQPQTAEYFAVKHNNPWVALEAAAEYAGWGMRKLDGPAVDLHRSSVKLKTIEELEEAIGAIEKVSVINQPFSIKSWERQEIEHSLEQSADAIYALIHYMSIMCEEYQVPWHSVWERHTNKLVANQYVTR
ncbi:helix-turn-helix transcriptional regulator [Bacillus tianshenii]|nr:helix-turn-helix transcriptional regulator [Bacillus tianshenii]